ncbi:MAG: hypothetical protein AAGE52_40570 [Myxococcota bacterium]
MVIEAHGDVRGYFRHRLRDARERLHLDVTLDTEHYLVDLLAERPQVADQPLVQQWARALSTEDPREKLRQLRSTGDAALYTCGFFADHVSERGISADYFVTMGGRAYRAASELCPHRGHTYGELAEGFRELVVLLDEVREETVLRTPQDIVRLYDKWRRTQSPKLAARLHAAGVFPTVPKGTEVH